MKQSRLSLVAIAALLGVAMGPGAAARSAVQRDAAQRAWGGGARVWSGTRHQNGPGWTQAQVKRMARKRRNQARNKAHHQRARGGR